MSQIAETRELQIHRAITNGWVSLHADDPSNSGRAEISGLGYKRQAAGAWVIEGNHVKNAEHIHFGALPEGNVTYIGLWNKRGYFQLGGLLSLPRLWEGDSLLFNPGDLMVTSNEQVG